MRVVPYAEITDDGEPEYDPPPEPSFPGRVDLDGMVQRAVGEQLAEQRMVRATLDRIEERIRTLERDVSERLGDLEEEVTDRVHDLERSVTDRMVAFEGVLKRLVDRLAATETRIVEGLDHNDRMVRAHLDALRPTVEAGFERVMEATDAAVETHAARLEAVGPTVEASVLAAVSGRLDTGLDGVRSALDEFRRKVSRDVNRLPETIERLVGDLVVVPPVETARLVDADDDADDEAADDADEPEEPLVPEELPEPDDHGWEPAFDAAVRIDAEPVGPPPEPEPEPKANAKVKAPKPPKAKAPKPKRRQRPLRAR